MPLVRLFLRSKGASFQFKSVNAIPMWLAAIHVPPSQSSGYTLLANPSSNTAGGLAEEACDSLISIHSDVESVRARDECYGAHDSVCYRIRLRDRSV